MGDPFRHHPSLRAEILAPEQSFFFDFTWRKLAAGLDEMGLAMPPIFEDEDREARRLKTLAATPGSTPDTTLGSDVWIFGYGSLMWDPGFRFDEVRRARVEGYARRFVLKDMLGGRGTPERPGVMAALAPGGGCDGLVFRVPGDLVDEETARVWRREQLGPAYTPLWHPAQTAHGPVDAILFVADPEAEIIALDLPRADQVEFLATGKGFLGTSYAYIAGLADKLRHLKIEDAEMENLLRDVEARRAALGL